VRPVYYLFDDQYKLKSFAAGEYVIESALERMLKAGKRQPAEQAIA
jgi:hypothetical protein